MKLDGITPEAYVNIYPVGFYRDVRNHLLKQFRPRVFIRWFLSSYKRRSYWNGFLCEPITMPENLDKCGRGLTQGSAYRSYMGRWKDARDLLQPESSNRDVTTSQGGE